MALTTRFLANCRNVAWQMCVRSKHKWHSKHPRPKTMERRVFEAITQPIYPEQIYKSKIDPSCSVVLKERREAWKSAAGEQEEENLYENFLLKQCQKMFEENAMLAFCHRLPISGYQNNESRRILWRSGFYMHRFSNEIVKKFVKDTKWENMTSILNCHNIYVSCPEPRVREVVKVLKKIPQFVLLGGLVENTLLSKAGMERCAQLPPLDMMLGETVSVLGHSAQKTSTLLMQHQQDLSRNLEQYIKDRTPCDNTVDCPES